MRQLFIAILLVSLSIFSEFSVANENLLQTKKRDHKWMQMLSELDLNSQKVTLDYKVGTTSVGLKIIKENDYIAYWYPEGNISAQSEGQVVTYYLGRFFDMSEIVTPSEYFQISGKSIQTLIDFLKNDTEDKEDIWKQKSITDVLFSAQQSLKNNTPMNGVIALKMSNFEPYELVDYENNRFNIDHEIAKMIRADQKQPSSIKVLNLPDFYPEEPVINTSTELDLARELSKIMVLDMLMGQLDRFSGGNLEARFDEDNENPQMGRFHFLIRDNGAAYLSEGGPEDREFEKYKSYVTRFDRKQIQKISLLLELIDKNPQELKHTLRMKSDLTLLQERAKAVLAHVEKQIQLYGEENVFFINL